MIMKILNYKSSFFILYDIIYLGEDMKKMLFIFIIVLLVTGCNKFEASQINLQEQLEINVNSYKDDNPIKVGLYENEYLVEEYHTKLINMKDIAVFNIYYTNEKILENV